MDFEEFLLCSMMSFKRPAAAAEGEVVGKLKGEQDLMVERSGL